MTEVQTKSYFFIYTIKLWNAWPQDAVVAKRVWGLKSKSEEFTEENASDGYRMERHCCWFSEKITRERARETALRLHCYPLPWMLTVGACHKENTGLDRPSAWLCTAILVFLTSLYISPWRQQEIHTFCPVEPSLKQVKDKKKAHGNPNRKHSANTEAQAGACRATSLHAPWDLKESSATCSQSSDADRQWSDLILSLFFFFPLQIMAELILIFWKQGYTWAKTTQQWTRSVTDSNSLSLIRQASTQGILLRF